MAKRFLIALCLLCWASPAIAAGYLATANFPQTLLTPPYAENSAEWQADISRIVEIQKKATPEQIKAADAEKHMVPELVTAVLGPEVNREQYGKLYSLLDRVGEDTFALNRVAKEYWNTRRPYVASREVKALIDAHKNPAYPSGHTSGSYVWAEVLGQLFPDKQAALRYRAKEIAEHRVLAGMHYPVDLEGGRQQALIVLGALWQNEAFRNDFAEVQKEVTTLNAPGK